MGGTAGAALGDDFYATFGFNAISVPKNATITDVKFSAYHNYTANVAYGANSDHASVGADYTWNANSVRSYNTIGAVLAHLDENNSNLNTFQTWDLGALYLSSGNLTVELKPLTNGWNDFQATAGNPALGAYLTVTYSAVPETSTWVMMLAGFAGIGFMSYRRNQKLSTMLA